MAIKRDSTWISKEGSPKAGYMECSSIGSITGTLVCLPFIKSSEFTYSVATEEDTDEGNNTYTLSGKKTSKLSLTFMQRDRDTMFMGLDNQGKYFTIVKEMNQTAISGKRGYLVIPIAKQATNVSIKSPGNDAVVEWDAQAAPSQIVVNLASFAGAMSTTLTGNATIASGEYSAYIEF